MQVFLGCFLGDLNCSKSFHGVFLCFHRLCELWVIFLALTMIGLVLSKFKAFLVFLKESKR